MADPSDLVPEPTDGDLDRIRRVLRKIGGPNVQWGAVNELEVLLTERRLEAEHLASKRLLRATWALVFSTIALVLATVGLIFATIAD